jgi:FdhD protein
MGDGTVWMCLPPRSRWRSGWRLPAVAPVVVTMRTPGHDFELAAGYLVAEGLVGSEDISRVSYRARPGLRPEERNNVVTV